MKRAKSDRSFSELTAHTLGTHTRLAEVHCAGILDAETDDAVNADIGTLSRETTCRLDDVTERVAKLDDEGRHAISIVTVTELRLGVNKRYDSETPAYAEAVEALDRLLAWFDLLEVPRPIAIATAEIIASLQESGVGLSDLHDVYIAATARTEQFPVLTTTVDHFERIDGVSVDWEAY